MRVFDSRSLTECFGNIRIKKLMIIFYMLSILKILSILFLLKLPRWGR